MVGCHFTKEEVVKVQKGLRFRFLESHNLKRDMYIREVYLHVLLNHLNSDEVMEVVYLVSSQSTRQWGQSVCSSM